MKRTHEDVYGHPVFAALDPTGKQFIEARWLPGSLNPVLNDYDIRVAALITFTIFPHLKTVPAVGMMTEDFDGGRYANKHTIVVPSSGNTAHAVARIAPAFGFREVKIVLSADTSETKKGILAALSSVEVIEVGGGKSVARRAEEEAEKPGHYLLDQYRHMGNARAHEYFTGPEVLRASGGRLAAVAVAMGSGGTVVGVGNFLHEHHPGTHVIGVRCKPGEQVPGARDLRRMEADVTLPWENAVDCVYEIGRKQSFLCMRKLWAAVEPQPGPTSGLAYAGLMEYLESCSPQELDKMRGMTCAFICPDDGRFYSERTTGELDTGQGL